MAWMAGGGCRAGALRLSNAVALGGLALRLSDPVHFGVRPVYVGVLGGIALPIATQHWGFIR